ncbi:MAG TPA: XRE family transcriptional regulator [Rhizomicrobium sp.]
MNASFRSNVFSDTGFDAREASALNAKSALVDEIAKIIGRRKLTSKQAASLCETKTALFSKILRGHIELATIELLARWLYALGQTVEFRVRP